MEDHSSLDADDRNALGVLDNLLVQAGVALFGLAPTLACVLFAPHRLEPLAAESLRQGRRGVLLGPGLFFLLAFVGGLALISVVFAGSGGVLIGVGDDATQALSDGAVWRLAAVTGPVFLATALLGGLLTVAAWAFRVTSYTPARGVRSALYAMVGLLVVVAIVEPTTALLPDPLVSLRGPITLGVAFAYLIWVNAALMPREPLAPLWRRIGAVIAAAGAAVGLSTLGYAL